MVFRHEINEGRVSRQLRRAAFRIVQESLANACRHSKSKRLFAELCLVGDVLQIKVRDWGPGFDPGDVPPGRFGLQGIRQRVKLLNGVATIQSEPGKGMSVMVELPLASDEPD
jgi:two-component system sensor histidine kinase DegS